MIKVAKRKKLTNKEKQMNAKAKKELQEKGILPPDKPRLNRKKYVEEAMQEWNSRDDSCHIWDFYLMRAVNMMLGKFDRNFRTSPEAVGAAKCLKIALRLKEFSDKLSAEGKKEYTLKEQLDFIKDIFDA